MTRFSSLALSLSEGSILTIREELTSSVNLFYRF